jgi:hypothetical protein
MVQMFGMVQCGSGARLAAEALERLRIVRQFLRKELQRDVAAELEVFGLVHPRSHQS